MAVGGDRRDVGPPRRDEDRPAEFRYAAVFGLILLLVIFLIVAPSANWSRAVALALQGAALIVVIATARARRAIQRRRAVAGAFAATLVVAGVAAGAIPAPVVSAVGALIAIATPFALVGGLLRLVRERGVTVQTVAGTLAIYLLVGLLFAWIIGLVARVGHAAYFAQGTDGTESQRVYFSFTTMTTTGFGDLTAGTPTARAVTVVEMLLGQIYLVTVIGVVVGRLTGRTRTDRAHL